MLAVYTHIQCMQNNKAGLRFTAVVNFTSELLQHIQVINILMVTSWRRRRGWRKTEVHTSSAYETKSK